MGAKKREKKRKKKTQTPSFCKTFVNRQDVGTVVYSQRRNPIKLTTVASSRGILLWQPQVHHRSPFCLLPRQPLGPGALMCRFALPQFSPLQTQHANRGSPAGLIWEGFSPRGSAEYGLPRREAVSLYNTAGCHAEDAAFALNSCVWPSPSDKLTAASNKDPNHKH